MNKTPRHDKEDIKKIFLLILGFLFFVFVIPILINECYKAWTSYETIWNGSDILSFYGTLLGVFVACATFLFTTQFSIQQIEEANILHQKLSKLSVAESYINETLDIINPCRINLINAQSSVNSDINYWPSSVYTYSLEVKIALNKYFCYMKTLDLGGNFESSVANFHKQLTELSDRIEAALMPVAKEYIYITTPSEKDPENDSSKYHTTVEQLKKDWDFSSEQINSIYSEYYLPLLEQKAKIFQAIRRSILSKSHKRLRKLFSPDVI